MKLWSREPTLIVAFVAAAVALAVGFGLPVTAEQVSLIMAFVVAGLGFLTRSQVTPAAGVVAQVSPAGYIVAGPALLTVDNGLPVSVTPASVTPLE